MDRVSAVLQGVTGSAVEAKALVQAVNQGSPGTGARHRSDRPGVLEMQPITQRNAAGAEESASASEQLSAQSESLNAIVGKLSQLVGAGAA